MRLNQAITFSISILIGCGGRVVSSAQRDDAGISAPVTDAGDDLDHLRARDRAGTDSRSETDFPIAACMPYAAMLLKDSCYECMQAATQCEVFWSELSSSCATRYECAVAHWICRNEPACESDTCQCIASCLPATPNSCNTLWGQLFQCNRTSLDLWNGVEVCRTVRTARCDGRQV
jgi:hypothetical protein